MASLRTQFLAWSTLCVVSTAGAQEPVDFGRQIRPILSDRCFVCHGPDEGKRKAELRLDLEVAAKESVVVGGDAAASEMFRRITHDDPEERMPPADSHLSLTTDEIALIERWIDEGATWGRHWSFTLPRRPEAPEVLYRSWPRSDLDRFVLARLETVELRPQAEVDRETLIRRATFDLTGLPPTLSEIDAFLADDSPDAYEKVVARLLASERYGERMSSAWLDVARYSDSYGYQVDRDRRVWPWRDWVVRAFNTNLSYDRFVTWQLAGDLLPDATDDQILATTFNRLHGQKVEGGSVPEEFRVEYVADRTTTFGTAFLGLTLECSRCHDHKYDPLTQKEFYGLFAFFNNIDEAGLYSYFTNSVPTPTLRLADAAKKAEVARVDSEALVAERELEALVATRRAAFESWLVDGRARAGSTPPGEVAHLDFEGKQPGRNRTVDGPFGKAVELTGDDGVGTKVGNFKRFEPFSVTLWLNTPDAKERAVVFHRSRAWTDAASRGYQLLIESGRLSASLIHFWPGNAIRVHAREKLVPGQWHHVAVTYDGSSRAAGVRIWIDGRPAAADVVRDNLYKNITGGGGDQIVIGERFRDRGFTGGKVDEMFVYDRELTPLEVAQRHDGESLARALASDASQLDASTRDALFAFYLEAVDAPYREMLARVESARGERSKICDPLPEIMVMRELRERRPTFVLARGAYDARTDRVEPATPAALPRFGESVPRDRLGLARWLTDPEHPLTARVAVNRLWQLCFGRGLVRTPEDFGSQGEPPSHPALLDWLACEFVDSGWDVKAMLTRLVTSATYRQSSAGSAELRAQDPENRLLARAPRYRRSAEMLRDSALAVSGLLVDRIGGPPARPPEVGVSFKPVKPHTGDQRYRRSLYTYWKRTAPAPVMVTLDASRRAVCRMRRERTESPLQALILLNGPEFVEAARVLAERLLARHGDDPDRVLVDMFRLQTSRRPAGEEIRVLRELYDGTAAYFEQNPDDAVAYLGVGESPPDATIPATRAAAAAVVANTLMSFDDCVMKR